MIDLRKESRALSRALKSAAEKAKASGVKNPRFFAEAESLSIYVIDGDIPPRNDGQHKGCVDQAAIVGEILLRDIGAIFDTGAW